MSDFETSDQIRLSFQVGLNLAINAIRDVGLVVDGPNCVIFRTSQIQGNHDWLADLLRSSGLHRVADTDCTTERLAIGDDRLLRERLLEMDQSPGCELVVLSAMSPAAITGRQYDRLLELLGPQLGHPAVFVPCGSLSGDWLDGYQALLETLARSISLEPGPGPAPNRVALVGHLMDRLEGDQTANLAELRRLLTGLDLELSSCWLDGGPVADLGRVADAGTIVSLPYGREAARILAERTGARLVECGLPIGLEGTCRFLRTLGTQLDRQAAAEALIDRELGRLVPRLQWVLTHALATRRLIVVADPHLQWALAQAVTELGCQVIARFCWADPGHLEEAEREADAPLLCPRAFQEFGQQLEAIRQEGYVDLLLTNSHALLASLGPQAPPFVEIGFPSHNSHALFDSPFMGFSGVLRLADRLVNALSRHAVRQAGRGPETRDR